MLFQLVDKWYVVSVGGQVVCCFSWWTSGMLFQLVDKWYVVSVGGQVVCCFSWWTSGMLFQLVDKWYVVLVGGKVVYYFRLEERGVGLECRFLRLPYHYKLEM